jgi:hypothetical protein
MANGMDLRSRSYDREIYNVWTDRSECEHTETTGSVVDTEVTQVAPRTFDIFEIRVCPKGHYFRVFVKTHVISDETIRSMYM